LRGAKHHTASEALIRFQGPEKLRFPDLVTLAATDPPPAELQARLQRVLEEPFISNEATRSGAKPNVPFVRGIGPALRIAEWNINRATRGAELKLALSGEKGFVAAAPIDPVVRRNHVCGKPRFSDAVIASDVNGPGRECCRSLTMAIEESRQTSSFSTNRQRTE
jgi:hypothetical protein